MSMSKIMIMDLQCLIQPTPQKQNNNKKKSSRIPRSLIVTPL